MLTKPAITTVIPGTPGRDYEPASHVCSTAPPFNDGDVLPPPGGGGTDGAYVPDPGTPILLEAKDGAGGYTSSGSVAPAPAGYVCRLETVFVNVPGQVEPAAQYNVVCTEQ